MTIEQTTNDVIDKIIDNQNDAQVASVDHNPQTSSTVGEEATQDREDEEDSNNMDVPPW